MTAERLMAVILSVLLAAWLIVTLRHHPVTPGPQPAQPAPAPSTPSPDRPKRPAPRPPHP